MAGVSELHSSLAEHFSVTRGGPFYHLEFYLDPASDERTRVIRRALIAVLVAWLPLLILSAAQGLASGGRVQIPFLEDFAANSRFLMDLPLFILSERPIDGELGALVHHFLKAGLVKDSQLSAFEAAIAQVIRLRDRLIPELAMLTLVYIWPATMHGPGVLVSGISSWQMPGLPFDSTPSYAGWWLGLISAPVFRFFLLRWLWRIFLWCLFLRRVSKLDLNLIAVHPDLAGGLGFLSEGQTMLALVVLAGSVVIAGQAANALAYQGATLDGFKFIFLAYGVCGVVLLIAPLLLVSPALVRLKRRGILEYGALASGYSQAFDAKWIIRRPQGEALLGSPDIQSLADMANSFAIVRNLRIVPIDKRALMLLIAAAVLPIAPVVLMAAPADELMRKVFRLLI